MIKAFLKRRHAPAEHPAGGEGVGYEITTARFPDRSVIAFQKLGGGKAAALEITEQGAEVLHGLAAGAVLAELEDAAGEGMDCAMPLTRHTGASRAETEAFIHSLELLDGQEKKSLMGALPR